jgi:hypothetical protein
MSTGRNFGYFHNKLITSSLRCVEFWLLDRRLNLLRNISPIMFKGRLTINMAENISGAGITNNAIQCFIPLHQIETRRPFWMSFIRDMTEQAVNTADILTQ